MEFRILGALEVEGTVALGGPKQRAVLAQLLLAAGEPVPASRLVDEVWGERPPEGAARSLEVYASKLRQAIAPTGAQILRRGTGYALELGAARFDAREFRVLAAAGRAALAGGDPATAEARLTEALALWRGPALADLDGRAGAVSGRGAAGGGGGSRRRLSPARPRPPSSYRSSSGARARSPSASGLAPS